MIRIALIFILLSSASVFAQRENHFAFPETDSLYREDQFYISGTFHIISDRPSGIVQSGFSGGLHAGFIRDFPINKQRNVALGLGLGYSINVYNHNLILEQVNGNTVFRAQTNEESGNTNRFRNQLIEVPLQIRWRTSSPESYKFWRIYAGVRLGYMHSFTYESENSSGQSIRLKTADGLERLRAGATLTFGFNTFNFHLYYGLNSFFDDSVVITDEQGGFSAIKIGLMFFIL